MSFLITVLKTYHNSAHRSLASDSSNAIIFNSELVLMLLLPNTRVSSITFNAISKRQSCQICLLRFHCHCGLYAKPCTRWKCYTSKYWVVSRIYLLNSVSQVHFCLMDAAVEHYPSRQSRHIFVFRLMSRYDYYEQRLIWDTNK